VELGIRVLDFGSERCMARTIGLGVRRRRRRRS